jgi:hypothetical protein
MTPYYIKRVIYDDGSWWVTVGDMNNKDFEKQYEIDAWRLISGKPLEEFIAEQESPDASKI